MDFLATDNKNPDIQSSRMFQKPHEAVYSCPRLPFPRVTYPLSAPAEGPLNISCLFYGPRWKMGVLGLLMCDETP